MSNPHKALLEEDDCIYRVAAKAIITHKDAILLIRDNSEYWEFPGGGVGYGEDLLEALYRELEEEINLKRENIQSAKLLSVSAGQVKDDIPRVNIHFIIQANIASVSKGYDADEIRWFTVEELDLVEFDQAVGDISDLIETTKKLLS